MERFTKSLLGGVISRAIRFNLALWFIATFGLLAQESNETPPNFKVAFIADQGIGSSARKVLTLIKQEEAQAVIHQGDFEYKDDPSLWNEMISEILGPNFPYFASIGNHDVKRWDGERGYQYYLEERCRRAGITWEGDLGIKSALKYKGLFIILVAPGIKGSNHDTFIREQLQKDRSIWRICSWHKNMKKMQVGGKKNDTGWGVYEEARKGGAIIATGHEHSYSRTHLLSSIKEQTVASRSDTLVITRGKTFVFVSGLGGKSIRDQELEGDHWASVYTSDQKAKFGALFAEFNYKGIPNLAHFYFKNVDGKVVDEFWVVSQVEENLTGIEDHPPGIVNQFVLDQNYPNPFNPQTQIQFSIPQPAEVQVVISDMMGRRVRTLFEGKAGAGVTRLIWDGRDDAGFKVPSGAYLYQLISGNRVLSRRMLMIK